MQDYDVEKHKGYLIYAAATPAEGNKRWYPKESFFPRIFPNALEIHYMRRLPYRETSKRLRNLVLQNLDRSWETEEKFVAELTQ
jgi:hypothetical protein